VIKYAFVSDAIQGLEGTLADDNLQVTIPELIVHEGAIGRIDAGTLGVKTGTLGVKS
jgi:hypothetical protein